VIHLLLHLAVPVALAALCFRPRVARAALIMLATMAVDLDHLLADPVYDPARCSIGFHPLHTALPIALYAVVFVATTVKAPRRPLHLASLGLLVHMALDWVDCLG
jgi:hypothetical protein